MTRAIAAAAETVLELEEPQRGPGEGMGPCKGTGIYPALAYICSGVCLSRVPPLLTGAILVPTWVPVGKGGSELELELEPRCPWSF